MKRPPERRAPNNAGATASDEPVPLAKESLREATDALKSGAGETLQAARQAGDDFLSDQKKRLAEKFDEYTAALKAASGSLEQEEANPLTAPARRAAQGLEQAASYLRETSREDALHDLAELARKKPEWIFGALFVTGLATARFLKASPSRRSSVRAATMPRSSDTPPAATPVSRGAILPATTDPALTTTLP